MTQLVGEVEQNSPYTTRPAEDDTRAVSNLVVTGFSICALCLLAPSRSHDPRVANSGTHDQRLRRMSHAVYVTDDRHMVVKACEIVPVDAGGLGPTVRFG